jgi:adenylate kinase family enzyme
VPERPFGAALACLANEDPRISERDTLSVRRVSVVGSSGVGKTTLTRRLAEALDVPHVELDAIFHQPGWTELPVEEFQRLVRAELAADGWVVDGNYGAVRELVWAAADTVVWLDRSRSTVMRRLVLRSARRALTRQELWNGNREPLTALFRRDPRENIVRWSWTHHGESRERYASASTDPRVRHLTFVRLTDDAEVDDLIASARGQPSGPPAPGTARVRRASWPR